MSKELILMLHPMFGIFALIAAVWVFVDTLNSSDASSSRIKTSSSLVAVFMWLAYVAGGYWYVVHYGGDKALIKAGPWSFAHSFVMETKEHLFLMLLLLSTFLPMMSLCDTSSHSSKRKLTLWTSALIIILTLAMEGSGAVITMGVKAALLAT